MKRLGDARTLRRLSKGELVSGDGEHVTRERVALATRCRWYDVDANGGNFT
jgi:hypothetical protein